jgi:arylsulfatase
MLADFFILSVSPAALSKQPNFLLVVADDMGWTDFGSFGSEIDTPNLDSIAGQGVMFTDFHVSVSCSPRRSILGLFDALRKRSRDHAGVAMH